MRRMLYAFAASLFLAAVGFSIPAARGEDGYRLLNMDGHVVKWGTPKLGEGVILSYAVATGPTNTSGINNCQQIAGIDGLLAHSAVMRRAFDSELSAAFDMWSDVANIRFVPAKNATTADILISAEALPDGLAYADVTPASSNEQAIGHITKGIVCLNPNLHWTAAAPANPANDAEHRGPHRLKYILAHEIGHVLGLDHPSPKGELMSFEYNADMNGLQPGDIAGIIALYGANNRYRPTSMLALNAKDTVGQ